MLWLIRLLAMGPYRPSCGLCYHSKLGLPRRYLRSWKHFSGNIDYPIPCPDGGDVKECYKKNRTLYSGEYGKLRMDLAWHLLQCYLDDGGFAGNMRGITTTAGVALGPDHTFMDPPITRYTLYKYIKMDVCSHNGLTWVRKGYGPWQQLVPVVSVDTQLALFAYNALKGESWRL